MRFMRRLQSFLPYSWQGTLGKEYRGFVVTIQKRATYCPGHGCAFLQTDHLDVVWEQNDPTAIGAEYSPLRL